jgi:tetratricopeptide (TPR) repeat protein
MQDNNNIGIRGQESYINATSRAYYFHMAGDHEKSFSYNKELATYASKIGDLDVAERCYKRAIDDAEYLGRVKDKMDCLYNMTTNVYSVWGRYEEALSNYKSLLEYYKSVNDSNMLAAVLRRMGWIHYRKGEYDQAMELYKQSLDIARKIGDQQGIAQTLNNIAAIHYRKREYDQAMELFNQSLDIARKIGDQQGIARIVNNIALVLGDKEEYDQAVSYALQAYEILGKLKSPELQRSVAILDGIKNKLGTEAYERLVEQVKSQRLS